MIGIVNMDTVCPRVGAFEHMEFIPENPAFGGLGGEIAAQINELAFDWLDAPVERLGAVEVPMPYNDKLERAVIPNQNAIVDAIRRVCYR